MSFTFELTCLCHLNDGVFGLGKVSSDHIVGLVPLIRSNIHLESFNKFLSLNVVLLSIFELTHFSVVASNTFEVWASDIVLLVRNKLDSSVPFTGSKGSFDCFVENASLDEVFNR